MFWFAVLVWAVVLVLILTHFFLWLSPLLDCLSLWNHHHDHQGLYELVGTLLEWMGERILVGCNSMFWLAVFIAGVGVLLFGPLVSLALTISGLF
jgi:hypothetical protein